MKLIGSGGQQRSDDCFDYSGTIATGGTAQLCLPKRKSCSHLIIANNSSGLLTIQIGTARGTATIANGKVTAISVSDGGFGFISAPTVELLGGGNDGDPVCPGVTMPDWPPPKSPASAIAIMSASPIAGLTISSIQITNPGSGYLAAPYVQISPHRIDSTGVGTPSATSGLPLGAGGGSYYVNGTVCPTSAIAIWGATTGQAYLCQWMS